MYQSSTPTFEAERSSRFNPRLLWLAVTVVIVLCIVGAIIQGELGSFIAAGLQNIPLVVLAVLAYLGVQRVWAKALSLLWLAGLVGLMGLGLLLITFGILANVLEPGQAPNMTSSDGVRLAAMAGLSLLAVGIGCLSFSPAVRRSMSRILPVDPDSFVHTVALAAVIMLTLLSFVPLLVLGDPPLLLMISESGADLTAGQDDAQMLRTTVYGLVWLVPGAILAVGYAVRRTLGEALGRLGLVRPTLKQVGAAIGLAILLVIGVTVFGHGIDWFWSFMGWPQTDSEAFSELLAFAFSPLGAVVIGITAGLGEELGVRGVLQPRLGIFLSNLFFTGLHALQYNWDSLLVVFVIGMVLGLIRKRSNTTTSAIVHGLYDFILIMLVVLEVPFFME